MGLLFACLLSVPVAAQTPKPAARHQVGAADIFAALTRPDQAAELDALRDVRDALSATASPETVQSARVKLTGVLQAEEHHQADMPPELVMSGIASRIEAALAALEEARHASASPPARIQQFAVPALAAASGALAAALIACLAGLAGRGRQNKAQEALHDSLERIRRRIESGSAPGTLPLADHRAGLAAGEAMEAMHQAVSTVDRLGSAAREADGRLRTSIDEAEARLHAAATMAGHLEQWMEALPERLAATLEDMQAGGLQQLETASAQITEGVAPLAGLGDLLADYAGAVTGLSAQATESAEALRGQVAAMGGTLASAHDAAGQASDNLATLSQQIQETAESVLGRLDGAACATEEILARGREAVLSQLESAAESFNLEIGTGLTASAEALEGRLSAHADRVLLRILAGAHLAGENLAGRLASSVDAVASRFGSQADSLRAGLQSGAGEIAGATAALPAVLDGLRDAASQLLQAAGRHEAGLQDAAAALASESASLLEATHARIAADAAPGGSDAPSPETMRALAETLVRLGTKMESVLGAAETIRAQAAEHAEAAHDQAAHKLAGLFDVLACRAEACLGSLPVEAAALAATAAQLRCDAAELAARALSLSCETREPETGSPSGTEYLQALQSAAGRLSQMSGDLDDTLRAMTGQAVQIAHETQSLQNAAASAQARLAASTAQAEAAIHGAVALLGQAVSRLETRATADAAQPDDQASLESQAQLAMLHDRLVAWLEAGQADRLDSRRAQQDAFAAQAERLAAMLERTERAAERLSEAAASVTETAARQLPPPADTAAAEPLLAGLDSAIATIQAVAARLLESAQAQQAALSRAGDAAAELGRLVPAPAAPDGQALAGLHGLTSLSESLQSEAESLAVAALGGDSISVPAELISQMPTMLATIETSIQRLRSTATALALAGDARRKAA